MGLLRAALPLTNNNVVASSSFGVPAITSRYLNRQGISSAMNWDVATTATTMGSGPSIAHLMLLVFEAVMEVICVSLPGYIIARMGHFDAESQKFIANLNVMLFTPCLVFTKLASQLNAEKLSELAIIPVIFIVMTAVSWGCGHFIATVFRFKKRQANFVAAMSVFGNSNSLPISLVISLSKTLEGLHWDRLPNDTDDEVAARGILYLLIFQQLGQLLRWSWGYRVLLAPKEFYIQREEATIVSERLESGPVEDPERSHESTVVNDDGEYSPTSSRASQVPPETRNFNVKRKISFSTFAKQVNDNSTAPSVADGEDAPLLLPPDTEFVPRRDSCGVIMRFPSVESRLPPSSHPSLRSRSSQWLRDANDRFCERLRTGCKSAFGRLPEPLQYGLKSSYNGTKRFLLGLWDFMNPPLWSMGIAIIVASVPSLQALFFTPGTFLSNSVTRAVEQTGSVAVPLILVVLGANLARNTLPELESDDYEHPKEERNLIIASLLGRMFLPTLVTGPVIALMAKYLPISILDDPIFVIVCFLLTGAPSALQLAQICQINNVYMGAMARLLFQSYVVWILPSTLVLVMCALQVVKWAA